MSSLFPKVVFENKRVSIGERVSIGPGSYFDGKSPVSIGHDTMLAPKVSVLTNTHDYGNNPMWRSTILRPVSIGNYVWIGYGVIILPGVKIGDHVVVGAGAVVSKHVPDNAVVVGNPARIVKFRQVPPLDVDVQKKYPYDEDVFEDYLKAESVTKVLKEA